MGARLAGWLPSVAPQRTLLYLERRGRASERAAFLTYASLWLFIHVQRYITSAMLSLGTYAGRQVSRLVATSQPDRQGAPPTPRQRPPARSLAHSSYQRIVVVGLSSYPLLLVLRAVLSTAD